MIMEDCFAYRQVGNRKACSILNEEERMICRDKDKCPFYKTQREFERGIRFLEIQEARRQGAR